LAENLLFLGRHNPLLAVPLATNLKPGMAAELIYNPCAGHIDAVIAPAELLGQFGRDWARVTVVPLAGETKRPGASVYRLE
jgi:hypothetical protein